MLTALAEILARAERRDDGLTLDVPEGWTQGRTAYGGYSAAVALAAARAVVPELPPLRSAQIAFVGPVSGRIVARVRVLRQGRSVSFVAVEIDGGKGVAFTATFVFAVARESALRFDPAPMQAPPLGTPPPEFDAPAFRARFDFCMAGPLVPGIADLPQWVRLREREGLDAEIELMAVGDALPPAALLLTARRPMLSSVNWTIDLVRPVPATRDGWWLLRATAAQAADGYSVQAMTVHDRDGALVATGSQNVAIFA